MDEQLGLGPQDEAFIDEAVKSGRYASREDVVREGLRVLREREDQMAAIRTAVRRGIEDANADRVVDLEEGFDQIEAMLDEMEATRRA
jgi:antitoxin ParD1/3/4